MTLAPARAPLPSVAREAQPAAAAPAIQVTIGRLEVRATLAASGASAAPARKAAPQLTLAEYLDRRSRGGRR